MSHEGKSKSIEWGTPWWVVRMAAYIFRVRRGFQLDPCTPAAYAKAPICYDLARGEDGLELPWKHSAWMNPPFGHPGVLAWLKKAEREAMTHHIHVAGILPVRCDTAWWHEGLANASRIVLLQGRVQFVPMSGQGVSSAGFPSALVYWKPGLPDSTPPTITMMNTEKQQRFRT